MIIEFWPLPRSPALPSPGDAGSTFQAHPQPRQTLPAQVGEDVTAGGSYVALPVTFPMTSLVWVA